ncbi:MAG: MarR family winged helix-turn-helix transcriptional regulator [Rhodoblastus sp.]
MRRASRRVSQLYDSALAPSGLRSTQFAMLARIAGSDSPTMSELAAALVLDRSALAHNLKPLERDGLVKVVVDPDDRRSRIVTITSSGAARLAEGARLWRRAQAAFEGAYGKRRAAELRKTMDLLADPAFSEAFAARL